MTAEELLAAMAEPLPEDDGYCIIDPETRVITIPPEYQLLGVESDEKAERIHFKCPKIVGDDIDLSKLALRVNFRNAGQVVDQYLVDDVAVDGDNITFSWLLSRRVTQYEGDVNFIVCAVRVSGETITNEWNTTLATAQVLEGLEAEVVLPEDETDIVNQLLALAETRLNDVRDATSAANTAASNANQKAQEAENAAEDARAVTEQITKDSYLHTALQSFIDTVTASPTAYGNAIVKKIEGFIRQETTTGAQLFDAFHVDVVNGARNAKALNGGKDVQVTGKKSDSGTGYAYYTIPASLVDGKSIYVYGEYSGNASFSMSIKKSDNTWLNPRIPTRTWTKIDIPQGVLQVSVILYPNGVTATDETAIFKNIKVGFTQFETWEPYTGGQPAPNPDYPMVVQGTGYRGFFDGELIQGVYKVADGSFSGYDERYICNANRIPCNPGGTVTMKYDDSNTNLYLLFYKKDGTFISNKLVQNGHEVSQVAPAETAYCNFDIYNGGTAIPVDSAGNITVLINGKYAVCVKSEGINLCSGVESGAYLHSNGKPNSTENYVRTNKMIVKPNTVYKESSVIEGTVTKTAVFWDENETFIKYSSFDSDIQTPSNCKYMALNYNADGLTVSKVRNVMITEKSVFPNTYVPYQSNVTYIPVDYPLFEGDKIIQRNGEYKLLRKWGMSVFDGSEDESWGVTYVGTYHIYNSYIDLPNPGKESSYVVCDRFDSVGLTASDSYVDNNAFISGNGKFNLMTSSDRSEIQGAESLKTWLQSNPVTVVYELAEPTEETLSPEAQKALHSIMATDEQTELTIVGVPADAEVQNQFLLPRNVDGALNTTAYCTAEKNKIVLNELVAQNLDARVNKLEIDNASLTEQTIIVE